MLDYKQIWGEVVEYLSQTLNTTSFVNWIKPIIPGSIDGDVLTLVVENDVARNTLNRLYSNTIISACRSVCGVDLKLNIITDDEYNLPSATETPASSGSMLNPKYTFDNFVVGESNRFAHAAALAVANTPLQTYNPLFLYGGVGLGKTHLMHAIGNSLAITHPELKTLYVTCEVFTNELITALRVGQGGNVEFRQKYRDVDVLMVDDIQFIAGKTSTQSEFFHTFNSLYLLSKQIVLTSDRPPRDIPTLEARMYSRFECGLVVDIQHPDLETRVAILKQNAQAAKAEISDDVLFYIASKVDTNVRELEGALTRIIAFSQLSSNAKITREFVDSVLVDLIQSQVSKRITTEKVLHAVSEYYQIPIDEITGKKRDKQIALARQIVMYLCRKLISISFEDIGASIGGKHYTTVMHAFDKINSSYNSGDVAIKTAVNDIEARLQSL